MVKNRHRGTVSITLIRILLKYIEKAGFDPVEICGNLGIDISLLMADAERVSDKLFRSIWDEALQLTHDQNFGLHFGKEIAYNYPGGHVLFTAMVNCPTVSDALERFIRYNTLMVQNVIQPKMEMHHDHVHISWDILNRKVKIERHISEALLSSYMYMFRHVTDDNLNLVEVRFKHPKPIDTREHQQIFNAPLLFEKPANELVIEKGVLKIPILLANPQLLETLDDFAQKLLDKLTISNTWSDRVIKLLSNLLIRGEETGIEIIANELATSVRNLQIKLKEEGSTYRELIDKVRKEIALSYLREKKESGVTICDIAFLLGFSEQSAFNHAFKRWTGSTPRKYSRKMATM